MNDGISTTSIEITTVIVDYLRFLNKNGNNSSCITFLILTLHKLKCVTDLKESQNLFPNCY